MHKSGLSAKICLKERVAEQRHEFVNLGRWAQLGEFAFKGSRVEFSIDVARAELSSGWTAVLVNGGGSVR